MKKILMIVAAAAGLLTAASCQKEPVQGVIDGEKATVTLSVSMPELATKAISDGLSADIVYWAAFDENGGELVGMNGTAAVTGGKASFDVTLVKHYKYKFVFWAQASNCTAYDITAFNSTGKVTVDYEGNANDESRDAFYRQAEVMIQAAGEVKTIELYRPFAQINFLAADYKAVEAVGLQSGMTSTVEISGLPTVLNGLDGTVENLTGETELAADDVPADPAYLTVNGEKYAWYSMNYVLAGVNKAITDVTGVFNHNSKKDGIKIPVANVPYQRNYRTNIIGNFFTDNVTINLIVVEEFYEPDYLVEAATAEEINAALKAGQDVIFKGDVVAPSAESNGYGKTGIVHNGGTIDGNGNTLNVTGANGTWDSAISTTGGTIKNLTIASGFRGIFVKSGTKVYLENVILDGPVYTISCDSANKSGLDAVGSTFNGWTSYAATIGEVTFTECSFGEGAGYAYCRPYAPTTFTDCAFEAGFVVDPRATVVFENCTLAGVALTDSNLAELVSNLANATVR